MDSQTISNLSSEQLTEKMTDNVINLLKHLDKQEPNTMAIAALVGSITIMLKGIENNLAEINKTLVKINTTQIQGF